MALRTLHPPIADRVLDEVAVLLGPRAGEPLGAAVEAAGGRLVRTETRQVLYRPHRGITVRYAAEVDGPTGRATAALVAAAGEDVPDTAAVLEADVLRIAVFGPDTDPGLPGLARALDPMVVTTLLADLGVPADRVHLRLRAYRPGRRAVVEVRAPGTRLFLKVVPPGAAEALQRHHAVLAEHLPVPRTHGWSPELGVVVLEALTGRTLRAALGEDGTPLPAVTTIERLLDRLPPAEGAARPWSYRRHAALLGHLLPDLTDDLAVLTDRLSTLEAAVTAEPQPVHGDLHDAQLLVDGAEVVGLLDVDTHGTGRRTDDLGTLLAHLAVRADVDPFGPVATYAGRSLELLAARHDPASLLGAAAVRLLGLATGPFRVQQADWAEQVRGRVSLALRWAGAAAGETPLTALTPTSQTRPAPSVV